MKGWKLETGVRHDSAEQVTTKKNKNHVNP